MLCIAVFSTLRQGIHPITVGYAQGFRFKHDKLLTEAGNACCRMLFLVVSHIPPSFVQSLPGHQRLEQIGPVLLQRMEQHFWNAETEILSSEKRQYLVFRGSIGLVVDPDLQDEGVTKVEDG